jgi:hypothetical protein
VRLPKVFASSLACGALPDPHHLRIALLLHVRAIYQDGWYVSTLLRSNLRADIIELIGWPHSAVK